MDWFAAVHTASHASKQSQRLLPRAYETQVHFLSRDVVLQELVFSYAAVPA